MKKILHRLSRGKGMYQETLLEKILLWLIYNRPVRWVLKQKDYLAVRRLKKIDSVLVISDVNIGDSIMLQAAVEAFRHYFPDSEIDYMYNAVVQDLVAGNPAISNSYPLFKSSTSLAYKKNVLKIGDLLQHKQYDLVINICPLITKSDLRLAKCPVISPLNILLEILNAEKDGKIASLPYRLMDYLSHLISHLPGHLKLRQQAVTFQENKVFLEPSIMRDRDAFLQSSNINPDDTLVFINPDTSNIYTFIDPQLCIDMIHLLLQSEEVDYIILGWSFKFDGVSAKIYQSVSSFYRQKVILMPEDAPLSFYAAMVDRCDSYISGDTGPLHIAAARKISTDAHDRFANKTSIANLFRATEPAIYGYDSESELMIDSGQDAPVKLFDVDVDCKRISCTIQRVIKTCDAARCATMLDAHQISKFVRTTIQRKDIYEKTEALEFADRYE